MLVTSHSITLTGLSSETTYYFVVNSTDASGNAGESSEYSFTTEAIPDTTPPLVIGNVANTDPTTDSITITWDTVEDSDSLVRYGTESGEYPSEEYDAALVTSHSITLTGLSAETTYYYMVCSTDASGNAGESSEYSFTTAAIADNTPVVLIGNVAASPDESTTEPIMVNSVSNLGSGTITVTYNPLVVHVTDVTSGTGNAFEVQDWNADNTNGSVSIVAWDTNAPHSEDVVFAVITYHAVGNHLKSTTLNITVTDLINYSDYSQIEHAVSNGAFTVNDTNPPEITNAIATPSEIFEKKGKGKPRSHIFLTRLNATIFDAGGIVNVTVNLSSIGGSPVQPMERIAGTDVWTVTTYATSGINLTHELVVTVTDVAGNTNTSSIYLTVLLRGDIVRDGHINSGDALYIAKYLVGKESMLPLLIGDIAPLEGDGVINSADAFYLAKYLVGKEVAP